MIQARAIDRTERDFPLGKILVSSRFGRTKVPSHGNYIQCINTKYTRSIYDTANSFLMFAIARAGFRFFGHVLEQFKMVWHL
jgi:hypothetical protein